MEIIIKECGQFEREFVTFVYQIYYHSLFSLDEPYEQISNWDGKIFSEIMCIIVHSYKSFMKYSW